jgi:4'-phosphopantetheinyl transferase
VPAAVVVRTAAVGALDTGSLDDGSLDDGSLDDGELARAARLHRPHDRARFVTRHALLREVVGETTGVPPRDVRLAARCTTCGGAHGKPYVQGEGAPKVSVSSSGDLAAVALTTAGEVGVDVESVAAVARRPVADALAPGEAAASARALAVTWVRKEAVLKATGDGLVVPPSDLVVSAADQPARLLVWRGRPLPAVRLLDLRLPDGYVGCVAVLTTGDVHLVQSP